jgi:hypothetical protein
MPFKNPLPMKLSVKGWNLKNERKVKIVVEKREIMAVARMVEDESVLGPRIMVVGRKRIDGYCKA